MDDFDTFYPNAASELLKSSDDVHSMEAKDVVSIELQNMWALKALFLLSLSGNSKTSFKNFQIYVFGKVMLQKILAGKVWSLLQMRAKSIISWLMKIVWKFSLEKMKK